MINRAKLSKRDDGFTIIELIIATSVFGVVMLMATAGVMHVGRIYYKGIISSKTQETARSVSQEISGIYQYSGAASVSTPPTVSSISDNGFTVNAICIGKYRYSYILGAPIGSVANFSVADPTKRTAKHALWVDTLKSDTEECEPQEIASEDIPDGTPAISATGAAADRMRHELLGRNMRLEEFSVKPVAGQSYAEIKIRIIYGGLDLHSGGPGSSCIASRFGGQFCADSSLSTIAKKR